MKFRWKSNKLICQRSLNKYLIKVKHYDKNIKELHLLHRVYLSQIKKLALHEQ